MIRDLFAKALDRHRSGALAEAAHHYRAVLALEPSVAAVQGNLATALRDQGLLDEAAPLYLRALRGQPQEPALHLGLATLLHYQAKPEEAAARVRQAIALAPGLTDAYGNLGGSLQQAGRLAAAEAAYRRAESPEARLNLALLLLLTGRFREGWPLYEARWETVQLSAERRDFAQPQWRGEPAAGKTLLLHAEQGFGDTIQFSRYAALAAERGLEVVMEVQPPLVRLLRSTPGCARVIGRGEALPPFDLHCPMMSMPLAVGPAIPPMNRIEVEGAEIPGDWRKIGLVWAGAPRRDSPEKSAFDRRRSLPPARLAPILALSGCGFFSLQKDGVIPPGLPIIDLMEGVRDFTDTAALIQSLDLVISVDTAVAHLAASLGKPVWLLNRFDTDWRWGTAGAHSPWYPTLRIFRQSSPDDWDGVIAAVASAAGAAMR